MIELLLAAEGFCVPTEQSIEATAVVAAYVEAYNAHDLERVRGLFTVDARVGNGRVTMSGAQLLANYETIVFARFPDVHIDLVDQLAIRDLVAQTETVTGIGAPETGLSAYRVEGGCIVEMSINQ